jgi:hypothetical protein
MLFLYGGLARWEEAQCLARFGESYRAYQAKTGMFAPRTLSLRLPRLLPASGPSRTVAAAVVFVAVVGLSVAAALALRDYSLSQVTAIYHDDVAILSPARLTPDELEVAYRTAMDDAAVEVALDAAKPTKQIVYVIPQDWYLPDLPVEAAPSSGGVPHGSADFDRSHYKVLFARARSHDRGATGPEIVRLPTAWIRSLWRGSTSLLGHEVARQHVPEPIFVFGREYPGERGDIGRCRQVKPAKAAPAAQQLEVDRTGAGVPGRHVDPALGLLGPFVQVHAPKGVLRARERHRLLGFAGRAHLDQ